MICLKIVEGIVIILLCLLLLPLLLRWVIIVPIILVIPILLSPVIIPSPVIVVPITITIIVSILVIVITRFSTFPGHMSSNSAVKAGLLEPSTSLVIIVTSLLVWLV